MDSQSHAKVSKRSSSRNESCQTTTNLYIYKRINDVLMTFHAEMVNYNKAIITRLDRKVTDQKLFLNMVVHDLRNPAESIQQGLELALTQMGSVINQHFTDITREIEKAILMRTSKIKDSKIVKSSSQSNFKLKQKSSN